MSDEKTLFVKQKDFKAGLTVKTYGGKDNPTYEEVLALLNQAIEIRDGCGPSDPAFEHFARKTLEYSRLVCAINWIHQLGRTDHLDEFQVIWSYDKSSVVQEGISRIPKGFYRKTTLQRELEDATREQLLLSGVDYKLLTDLEVVLA